MILTKPPVVPIGEPKAGEGGYQPLNPRSEVLPAGWNGSGYKALTCDIQVDHDFSLKMRDGKTLYMDIYRPANSDAKVPAIVCWSPFGKKFNGRMSLQLMTPWNLGVPDEALSGLEKFEAPDPADWVPQGYAVVNVDSRGTGDSEGVMATMGTQEAEDGYDTIEGIAKESWCNGNIGLAGNSHLAIIQWFIAALRPPSLKAIAPWEGCGDLYREQFGRGGIYAGELFDKLIVKYMLKGRHGMESFQEMWKQHPLSNWWWEDKRPDMKKINIPTYITGTWTNTMHGMGAIRGWLEVDTPDKWLRWHPWQEWFDLWGNPQAKTELMQFFDHFLKGEDNGWEKTPKVRMAVLKFGKSDPLENVPEQKLAFDAPAQQGLVSYNSESDDDAATFTYTFPQKTQIVGMPKAVFYMSCNDADDMDIYVLIEKLDASGKPMLNLNIPWKGIPVQSFDEFTREQSTEVVLYKGPSGILRASHRAVDWERSMHPNWPFHPHQVEEKIQPLGTVVKLDIGIWAMGVEYEAGEALRVVVSGRNKAVNNFGTSEWVNNKGAHKLHFGGDYASHVILPFV
ncbi:hypothetical protein PG994_005054 [Apiospora phragmitis]|uniref:Xaa-Pro dipeptidyl-peptidase C-terminal domain-containing protein n=1 Tax=Apiospora phragmitis TaxID=2905665 RepID=A0ABR1VSB9_9PEZI